MRGGFDTTRWSIVLAARDGTGESAQRALSWLCEAYWYPVYAFVRRRGHDPDEAADLTQGYFTRLLEKDYLDDVRPELGRFRSFLLKSVQHYLSNERDRARAHKRGGGRDPVSLDGLDAERRLALEPRDDRTPESFFEQLWATSLLERALDSLKAEATAKGRIGHFELLAPFLTQAAGASYQEVAAELRVSESAVKVAVHRLRRRFGELLREEIAATVREPGEVDSEIRHLFAVLERRGSRAP
jgi:RNA polymerase sigma-70 factor (ECF subfamily)